MSQSDKSSDVRKRQTNFQRKKLSKFVWVLVRLLRQFNHLDKQVIKKCLEFINVRQSTPTKEDIAIARGMEIAVIWENKTATMPGKQNGNHARKTNEKKRTKCLKNKKWTENKVIAFVSI